MNRQYIHFVTSKTLLKKASQVITTLTVKKYIQEGMKLYRLNTIKALNQHLPIKFVNIVYKSKSQWQLRKQGNTSV